MEEKNGIIQERALPVWAVFVKSARTICTALSLEKSPNEAMKAGLR